MYSPRKDPFRQARVCECGDHGFVGLTRGHVAFFDAEDLGLVAPYCWSAFRKGPNVYARGVSGTLRMHRLIVAASLVDHRDGDGCNNRRSNLRACNARQNGQNRFHSTRGVAGFKGVTKRGDRYDSRIRVEGVYVALGAFDSPQAAALAYDAAALRYFGEFARTNAMLGLLPEMAA